MFGPDKGARDSCLCLLKYRRLYGTLGLWHPTKENPLKDNATDRHTHCEQSLQYHRHNYFTYNSYDPKAIAIYN